MSIKPIAINNTELLFVADSTKLNKSVLKGDTTVDVYSINGFDINTPLLLGGFGSEGAEIINSHLTTDPAGNTITLASALTKDHNQDTEVFSLVYDQVELAHADTEDGAKTVYSAKTINPEEENFILTDTAHSSGYYFIRYKNSIALNVSDFSDAIPYEGLESDTVGAVINEVLEDLHESLNEKLTQSMLISALNRMMREVRGRLNKWSNYQKFNQILGVVEYGEVAYDLPDDIYNKDTNKSVKKVKIGPSTLMEYVDKDEFDRIYGSQIHTQIAVEASIGDVTLALDSTADLDDAGTITVFVDDTAYQVTYDTNTKSTNTLSGIPASGDGSITVVLPVDSNIWDNGTYAGPEYYTIFNEKLRLPYITSNNLIGVNIYIDYWTDIEKVDSDADVLKMPRYDMAFYYLKSYVRSQIENNGIMEMSDPDYVKYLQITNTAIAREHTGQKTRRGPNINGITYRYYEKTTTNTD